MELTDPTEVGAIETEAAADGQTRHRATVPEGGLLYDVSDYDLLDKYLVVDLYVEDDVGASFEVRLLTDSGDAMYPRTYVVDYVKSPGANVFSLFPPGVQGRIHFAVETVCEGGGLPFPNPVGFCFHNPTNRISVADVEAIQIRPVGYDRELIWRQRGPKISDEDPGQPSERETDTRPVLDRFGKLRTVDGRRPPDDETLGRRVRRFARKQSRERDDERSEWGGSTHTQFEATGFFDTRYDGNRWWFIDPDGRPFWSVGINNVRPDVTAHFADETLVATPAEESTDVVTHGDSLNEINNLAWNLARAFGEDWRKQWVEATVRTIRGLGFNTAGTWIDEDVRSEIDLPYIRLLDVTFDETPILFDRAGTTFPDVYHETFEREAATVAEQLADTAEDPALLGYYLGNYPTLSLFPPAELLLTTTGESQSRTAFIEYLREKYGSDRRLSRAWGHRTSFADIHEGGWETVPEGSKQDVEQFSGRMVDRLFGVLTEACRSVDDNHLNLGPRLNMYLPRWLLQCAKHVDVFSPYGYFQSVQSSKLAAVYDVIQKPILISEWSVGATDAETPFAGYCRTPDQDERAKAYRRYVEEAAACPWCVGAHYFSYYDQPALGREDGEAFNTGLFDVCNQPYREMIDATTESYKRIYDVAIGDCDPVNVPIEYLTKARSNI